jgi:hypothetical protein
MPEPIVITPTMAPRLGPGNRSAVLAVTAGPRAPHVSPKNDACSQSSQPWWGPERTSAQITPTIETP